MDPPPSATEDNFCSWFPDFCRQQFPSKPGETLHFFTGYPIRSCRRYATGTSEPPAGFLVALLRSKIGRALLNAIMTKSGPEWWLAMSKGERIYLKLKGEWDELD